MSFITYAQNFEDVTLWRALKAVEEGFYVDVGASDPDAFTVTRAFSERGWRGINIEPLEDRYAQLQARRPRDVNLCIAVGEAAGTVLFYALDGDGLSTTNRALAERHVAAGFVATTRTVAVETLAAICDRYAPGTIHFLKIDCEGSERAVLQGADLRRHRPWIVLLEATEPLSQVPSYEEWEPLLLDADYRFAWFDGLNRFYVAAEHFERLGPLVAQPPNVFDEISFAPQVQTAVAPEPSEAGAEDPLVQSTPASLAIEERIALAARCRDCDDVPKVASAGLVQTDPDGTRVQIMHNGLKVLADGYCGPWMTRLIALCRGHHEPQKERLFHQAVRTLPSNATMIELGGNWAYYTAWFLQGAPGRTGVVLEPDPLNRDCGRDTMRLNGLEARFVAGFAGAPTETPVLFQTERSGELLLQGYSIGALMQRHAMERLDLLHCDTHGAELAVLEGCRALFEAGRIGTVFVSTHVPAISGDPLTHQRCLTVLQACGAVIEAEHDPYESYSGDGLIVARFGAAPAGWRPLEISRARRSEALFRDPLFDLTSVQGALQTARRALSALQTTTSQLRAVMSVEQAARIGSVIYEALLFRPSEPGVREHWGEWLAQTGDLERVLHAVLKSQEFRNQRRRFAEAYFDDAMSPNVAAGGGPVAGVARQLVLTRDGLLGDAGDRLVIPEDRVILPAVLMHGCWASDHTTFVGAHLAPGQRFTLLDIGGNCGLFSRQVLRAFPQFDQVVCAEPDPENYAALCHNLTPFAHAVAIRTDQVALGAEAGSMTFFRDLENCGNYSLHEDAVRDRPHTRSTVTVAEAGAWLTEMLPGDQAIVWKSDTQGNDEVIIAATPMQVWRRVAVAIVELWRIRKSTALPAGFLEKVADMPNRRIAGKEVSVDDVAAYLAADDWEHEDLLMWR